MDYWEGSQIDYLLKICALAIQKNQTIFELAISPKDTKYKKLELAIIQKYKKYKRFLY